MMTKHPVRRTQPQLTTRELLFRLVVTFLVVFLVMVFSSVGAHAQRAMGTLRGTVTDPQAAVVGGATVIATNEHTNVSDTTFTTSAGTFVFPNIIPGRYTLKVEAK